VRDTGRIYHLDAVRCFCMLFGLMVHGSTIGSGGLFDVIKATSEHFRMAAFFLVSGYFGAMVASRSTLGAFWRNRSRTVLIPLFAGLVLLNPITNWLIHWFHGDPMSISQWVEGGWRRPVNPPAQANWHLHLWFLFSLFAYALFTPALLSAGRGLLNLGWVRWLLKDRPLSPLILAIGTALLTVALRAAHDRFLHLPGHHPLHFVVMATLIYFPFFGLGLLAFLSNDLFASLHRMPLLSLAVFGGLYYAWPQLGAGLPWAAERAGYFLVRAGFMLLVVMCVMSLARRLVTRGSPLLTMLTDSVYTFYIFHFLAIYSIAVVAQMFTSNLYVIFAAILIIGYPLLLALHQKVVTRSPFLLWLWNGKPLKGRKTNKA
jgi:glucan biosynthesis protein C